MRSVSAYWQQLRRAGFPWWRQPSGDPRRGAL